MRPLPIGRSPRESERLRFNHYVAMVPENNGCLLWIGSRTGLGYGRFWFDGRTWLASRMAWFLERGSIADGLIVLHKCDNPPCVNPAHLFLGTYKDNVADSAHKGRRATLDRHGRSKLTSPEVAAIRAARATGEAERVIAKRYRISQCQVSKIVLFQSWAS